MLKSNKVLSLKKLNVLGKRKELSMVLPSSIHVLDTSIVVVLII